MQHKMCSIYEYAVVFTLFVPNGFHVLAAEIHYRFYTATLHYCENISLRVLGRFALSFHTLAQGPMVCLNGSKGALTSQFRGCHLLWH